MTARPVALLFDWDNTLVDSWAVIHAAMNETLEAMGHPRWSRTEAETRIRASLRDSFPGLFGERWKEAEKVFYGAFEKLHLLELKPLPGAGDLVAWAAAAGFYMGVVSNKRGPYLRKEAAHLGWDKYFAALAGAGDSARDKPAREHVQLALDPGGLQPGRHVWFIGDTDIDLICGHTNGCIPVLVRPQPPLAGEFGEAAPQHYFPGLADLKATLAAL
ncbi:HAD family hydrolase [Dongia sp.]|uniref:HAD family hydrolase n=1 Tax=Dongia sp. TaxID=1977262 RepID=UPI0035ADFADE